MIQIKIFFLSSSVIFSQINALKVATFYNQGVYNNSVKFISSWMNYLITTIILYPIIYNIYNLNIPHRDLISQCDQNKSEDFKWDLMRNALIIRYSNYLNTWLIYRYKLSLIIINYQLILTILVFNICNELFFFLFFFFSSSSLIIT